MGPNDSTGEKRGILMTKRPLEILDQVLNRQPVIISLKGGREIRYSRIMASISFSAWLISERFISFPPAAPNVVPSTHTDPHTPAAGSAH